MGIWDTVDSSKQSIANPGVGVWLDADEADEEREHPKVTAGANEETLVEPLREPAKYQYLL